METIAHCESCGKPLHEGDIYDFDSEGLVYLCRACVEEEQARLREEFGWIGAGWGNTTESKATSDPTVSCEE